MGSKALVLQASYKITSVGLAYDGVIVDSVREVRASTSSMLVPRVQELLDRNSTNIGAMSCVMVDQGPGAFNSLRVLLASANAISYGAQCPLVGVDGLDALANDVIAQDLLPKTSRKTLIIPLLNAYNVECYYGVYSLTQDGLLLAREGDKGYKSVSALVEMCNTTYGDYQKVFVGNGLALYEEEFGAVKHATLCTKERNHQASLDSIAAIGQKHFAAGKFTTEPLFPLYLKVQEYAVKKPFVKAQSA